MRFEENNKFLCYLVLLLLFGSEMNVSSIFESSDFSELDVLVFFTSKDFFFSFEMSQVNLPDL